MRERLTLRWMPSGRKDRGSFPVVVSCLGAAWRWCLHCAVAASEERLEGRLAELGHEQAPGHRCHREIEAFICLQKLTVGRLCRRLEWEVGGDEE